MLNTTYEERVKFLIDEIAGGKKKEFARLVGKHPSTITQITQGKYKLTTNSKEILAKRGVNLNWLECQQGEPFTNSQNYQVTLEYFKGRVIESLLTASTKESKRLFMIANAVTGKVTYKVEFEELNCNHYYSLESAIIAYNKA